MTHGGKASGINAGRKLKKHRRQQRWHDQDYKKGHFGAALKADPLGGASHAKGIVVERLGIEAKQPRSTYR
jgi:small subunit ribosomal protein S23e